MTCLATPRTGHADLVRVWVDQYRSLGLQPLPTRLDAKRPLITYAQLWEHRVKEDLFAPFDYNCNIQVMTGAFWGVMVIDLDGPEAVAQWQEWTAANRVKRTWEVVSGSGGRHLWFALPRGCAPVPSGRLWGIREGEDWKAHTAIERLGEHKLAVAPPSQFVGKKRYNWAQGNDPYRLASLALAPAWLIHRPVVQAPAKPRPLPELVPLAPAASRQSGRPAGEVIDAIPDKLALAQSWGLRTKGRENAAGWVSCHAAGRKDDNPSASFSPRTGRYWAPETPPNGISLLELGVLLGRYTDWRHALDHLSETYQ